MEKNTMKKVSCVFVFFMFVSVFIFSQESKIQEDREMQESAVRKENINKDYRQENSADKQDAEISENEYILIPSLGYSSLGVTTGFDFMYRHNGLAVLTNLNFSVPITNFGGALFTSELYIGYALKKNRFYASFLAGTWVGGGTFFVGWDDHPRRKEAMNGKLLTIPSIMLTFALRGDLMYFFNDKLGLHFSHTHGLGYYTHAVAMDRRNYPASLTRHYVFMIKLGMAIRV